MSQKDDFFFWWMPNVFHLDSTPAHHITRLHFSIDKQRQEQPFLDLITLCSTGVSNKVLSECTYYMDTKHEKKKILNSLVNSLFTLSFENHNFQSVCCCYIAETLCTYSLFAPKGKQNFLKVKPPTQRLCAFFLFNSFCLKANVAKKEAKTYWLNVSIMSSS